MYSMCIEGITFRLENDHTKLTVMVPHDQDFPFRVIQKIGPANFYGPAHYYSEKVCMNLDVPRDTVDIFKDRIQDVKSVVIFHHDKRYVIDALDVEYECNDCNGFGTLYISPDTMSKFLVQ